MASINPWLLLNMFRSRGNVNLLDVLLGNFQSYDPRGRVSGTFGMTNKDPDAVSVLDANELQEIKEQSEQLKNIPNMPKQDRESLQKELDLRRKILEEREKRGKYNRTTSMPPQRYEGMDGRMFLTNPEDVKKAEEEEAIKRLLMNTMPSVYSRRLR